MWQRNRVELMKRDYSMECFATCRTARSVVLACVVMLCVVCDNRLTQVVRADEKPAGKEPAANDPTDSSRRVSITLTNAQGQEQTIEARILVQASDGLLAETTEGRLWNVNSDRLIKAVDTGDKFEFLSGEALGQRLQAELVQAGIQQSSIVHETKHYVVCSTAGKAYAVWAGKMLERLFKAFQTYWKSRGFQMPEPRSPMPVLILGDRSQFAKLAKFDKTPSSAQGNGYYLITANRIVLFDLTNSPNQRPAKTVADVQRRAQKLPGSVGVVVHEATHQIAFNTGLHRRYADNPIWMTEGMAMYFETPDLRSRRGWTTLGRVNSARLARYLDYVAKRKRNQSLAVIIQDNKRFVDPETALDAYAESWAVTHYLIKSKNRDYVKYLSGIAVKPRLRWDSNEQHLKEFQAAFGDLESLDKKVQAFARRLAR
jgi:hypothetical protein